MNINDFGNEKEGALALILTNGTTHLDHERVMCERKGIVGDVFPGEPKGLSEKLIEHSGGDLLHGQDRLRPRITSSVSCESIKMFNHGPPLPSCLRLALGVFEETVEQGRHALGPA